MIEPRASGMVSGAIAAEENTQALAGELIPMLTNFGFLLSMWDVQVIRGERLS